MPFDPATGIWSPRLFTKQAALVNSDKRFILATGPRACGKTIAVGHKVIQHMWHTPNAMVCAVSKTIKAAKHGGTYNDILQIILPEWIGAGLAGKSPGIRFEFVQEPKVDGATRAHYFSIRNWHGTESKFYLFSLDFDDDVEQKFKQTRFSCFWFIELSNFGTKKVFDVTQMQLRMPHLKREQHLWIADTNPADDGSDSWIYQMWFEKRGMDAFEDHETIKNMEVFDFNIDDNIFADPGLIADLKASCRASKDQWARMVEGKWVAYCDDGLFKEQFRPEVHVVGDANGPQENWNVIVPSEDCTELIGGWDIGSGGNSSAHVIQSRKIKQEDGSIVTAYDVLSELVTLNSKVTIGDFVDAYMSIVEKWEKFLGKQIQWRHWSDTSAFNFDTVSGAYQYMLVKAASGGRITLRPCPKYPGSVKIRVKMMQQLLFENRIYVSASCRSTIDMLKNLQKGKSELEFVRRDHRKHPFDSLTYALMPEESVNVSSEVGPKIQPIVTSVNW